MGKSYFGVFVFVCLLTMAYGFNVVNSSRQNQLLLARDVAHSSPQKIAVSDFN